MMKFAAGDADAFSFGAGSTGGGGWGWPNVGFELPAEIPDICYHFRTVCVLRMTKAMMAMI